MRPELPQPWRDFLVDLDACANGPVSLHCLGGFVVTTCYGLLRATADLDVLLALPSDPLTALVKIAGRGSALHKTHGVYLDVVTVATHPDGYEERLTEVFRGSCRHLRLFALDPYDLALAKLERNLQRDRDDVVFLAETVPLDVETLRARYQTEMRPYLGRPEREDLTLKLWIDIVEQRRADSHTRSR